MPDSNGPRKGTRHKLQNDDRERGMSPPQQTVEQFEDGFFVADDGPGIPPGDRARVFEYGYSTDDDRIGSGLAVAETIARSLGWELNVVQGTAGTTEDEITYSWNIAMVIADGQSRESLIPSPIMTSMREGSIARFEELTRCTSDVQDSLISLLSEKYVSIPELGGDEVVHGRRHAHTVYRRISGRRHAVGN
jgi:hypothetical protein